MRTTNSEKNKFRVISGPETSGFTLIELLIVIVLIGILSGVVLTVINPANQMRRSKQTVFRANAEKACLAFHACMSSALVSTTCSGATNAAALTAIGFTTPTNPIGATYVITPLSPAPAATLTLRSTYDTCVFTCTATPGNATVANFTLTTAGATCLIS